MGKRAVPDVDAVIARLLATKLLIGAMKDAMPRHAAELRREACEGLDDLIEELRR